MNERQHAAIIFADLQGYSALSDDLQLKISRVFEEIQTTIITPHRPLYVNTWGDAFMICLSSCADAAEIALKIRDHFKTYNWKKNHFSAPLAIRVGVHFSLISFVRENQDGVIQNVIGKGLSTGARIEPIVDQDKVFCSQLFSDNLRDCEDSRFVTFPLGEKELAKGFGVMHLFELRWKHESGASAYIEATPDNTNRTYIPFHRGKVTDREKRDFSNKTFGIIKHYFKNGAKEIAHQFSSIEILFQEINSTRVYVELYKDEILENGVLIWTGGSFSPFGINLSEGVGQDINNASSYNEILAIEDNNGVLTWNALMGHPSYCGNELGFYLKMMRPEQVAEYFWRRLIE